MIHTLFIEKHLVGSSKAQHIQAQFPMAEIYLIENYEDVFGKVRKPYLQKRDTLNLFLAHKKGSLVKKAPDAYGLSMQDLHYYFVHSYNCLYECQYCYLQGYFHSPDLVFFLNHEEICAEIKKITEAHPHQTCWFHAGEFSDSLALCHLTGELPLLFEMFSKLPNAKLELRTKSVNIQELKKLKPLPNIYVSFSLSPDTMAKQIDLKAPSIELRLKAMQELEKLKHPLAIHLDPMIYSPDFENQYQSLIEKILKHLNPSSISYVSLGVVRFTKDIFREVERNYPDSPLLRQDMIKSFDDKVRYNRPTRKFMMNRVRKMLLQGGILEKSIYFCMEE